MSNLLKNEEHRGEIARWDDEGGAPSLRQHLGEKRIPPRPLDRSRPDPANPLLNPATVPGHSPEDAAPAQPNVLPPDPNGTLP